MVSTPLLCSCGLHCCHKRFQSCAKYNYRSCVERIEIIRFHLSQYACGLHTESLGPVWPFFHLSLPERYVLWYNCHGKPLLVSETYFGLFTFDCMSLRCYRHLCESFRLINNFFCIIQDLWWIFRWGILLKFVPIIRPFCKRLYLRQELILWHLLLQFLRYSLSSNSDSVQDCFWAGGVTTGWSGVAD